MKKLIAVLLVLVMAAALCGVAYADAEEERPTYEDVMALVAEGKEDEAIEALKQLDGYEDLVRLVLKAENIEIASLGGLDKNDPASYLGNWTSGNATITFNKGGVGFYSFEDDFSNSGYSFSYEVEDEVVVITIDDSFIGKMISSFELNDDGTILSIIQNMLPIGKETVFSKEDA